MSLIASGAIELVASVQGRGIFGLDSDILLYIHAHTTPFLDSLFVHTTDLGGTISIVLVGVSLAAYFAYKRQVVNFLTVTGGIAGAAILVYAIKTFIERPRPNLWSPHLINETGFSFISGHSTMSMTVAAVIVVVLWKTRWKWLAIVGGGFYAVYVSFSRLYLGVHYPTDVLGGWIVGISWVVVVVFSLRLLFDEQKKHSAETD